VLVRTLPSWSILMVRPWPALLLIEWKAQFATWNEFVD